MLCRAPRPLRSPGAIGFLFLTALVCCGTRVFAVAAPTARPQPVPDEKAQKEAAELVRDFFKGDFAKTAPQDRAALASRLLREAQETNTDLDLKFALLREAQVAAVEGGRPELALQALDATGVAFAFDVGKEKVELLDGLARAAKTPEAAKNIATACLNLVEEALGKAQYGEARLLIALVDATSRKVKDDDWQKDIARRVKETQELLREYDRVASFEKTLLEKPDDPEANTALGKFACFVTGQWERGLEMLAKGSDSALKKLAQTELAGPADATVQAKLGDEWWQCGKSLSGKSRFVVQEHAVDWMQKALPNLDAEKRDQVSKTIVAFYTSAAEQGQFTAAFQVGNVALTKNGATLSRVTEGGELVPEPSLAMLDGVTTGYTGSTGFTYLSYPCAWVITLPKMYLLQEIRMLLWDGGERFYQYTIETSADGKNYQMVADCSKGEYRSWQALKFPPRLAKFIRLKGLFNSSNQGFHVVELEAYCMPPATPVTPKYSSTPNGEEKAERKRRASD